MPERLEYEIRWTMIPAGNTVLEIAPEGQDNLRIKSHTESHKWLNLFYKVDDYIEVLLQRGEGFLPIQYHLKLREGRHRKEREVSYDQAGGRIVKLNVLEDKTEVFDIEGEINDPLSAFYRVRTMPAEVGKSIKVRVFDNGKIYDIEVQVLRREKITVPAGTFDAIVMKPILMSEGVFMRKGDVTLWMSDDARRLMLKMKSKVAVGSINAVLIGGDY